MDRKQFLQSCAGGVCACMAACFGSAGQAAAEATKEDWRTPFVKERYAKLLQSLTDKMSADELGAILRDLGSYCAGTYGEALKKYRGDPDGFCAYVRGMGAGDRFAYDPARKMVIASSDERGDCICPLIGKAYKTPDIVCNCSLGWHQHAWTAIFGKKVEARLVETALRGGKHCTIEITVLEEPA